MPTINKIFHVRNGIASSGLKISPRYKTGYIAFVRPASTQQRTLSGWIDRKLVAEDKIFPKDSLIVSTNGEGSHSYSYVTSFEFVANSDVAVLVPKKEISIIEKLYYASCITANRYLFSYGRKPKGTRLKNILLPALPRWLKGPDQLDLSFDFAFAKLDHTPDAVIRKSSRKKKLVPISQLFQVTYGLNLELNKLKQDRQGVNFVSRTEKNNGISARVKKITNLQPISPPALTVAGGGSVLETFLQLEPFYSGRDLYYLKPKIEMTQDELLFYSLCIKMNKYKYSYGRQANRTLKDLLVPALDSLPTWVNGALKEFSQKIYDDLQ